MQQGNGSKRDEPLAGVKRLIDPASCDPLAAKGVPLMLDSVKSPLPPYLGNRCPALLPRLRVQQLQYSHRRTPEQYVRQAKARLKMRLLRVVLHPHEPGLGPVCARPVHTLTGRPLQHRHSLGGEGHARQVKQEGR